MKVIGKSPVNPSSRSRFSTSLSSRVTAKTHTSIYKKQWNPLTAEQLANPATYADCTHWCLPGLQDTWNELLFAKLLYPNSN
ncbi:hypothetical protein F3Y22_tig00110984pilonHSYRG00015 [Hibiscus syriacus]|uniref:Trichome birefringence-like C-terminal domain-containing protein n=1 Tax=Hibiscus syriacus TaxID=106335 RepID=A0A6A2Z915_HIBSY|nr:hypothetical protein F3Y22_tig00110984pilonHSYRG00015 [Hibiscus syriacus]